MLETPRISEPHTAPAFGGLLAWLRGCGLAFFLELWYGRALYRQMMATMAILDRMLLAFRAGSLALPSSVPILKFVGFQNDVDTRKINDLVSTEREIRSSEFLVHDTSEARAPAPMAAPRPNCRVAARRRSVIRRHATRACLCVMRPIAPLHAARAVGVEGLTRASLRGLRLMFARCRAGPLVKIGFGLIG